MMAPDSAQWRLVRLTGEIYSLMSALPLVEKSAEAGFHRGILLR